MFGMMEAMLSLLRRQIGFRTDTADPAGSVHAKLGDLKDKIESSKNEIVNAVQKPRKTYTGIFNTSSIDYVTALSIMGKGSLKCLSYYNQETDINIKITVDGNQFIFADSYNDNVWKYVHPNLIDCGSTDPQNIDVSFTQSLKIEVSRGMYNRQVRVSWVYEIEE